MDNVALLSRLNNNGLFLGAFVPQRQMLLLLEPVSLNKNLKCTSDLKHESDNGCQGDLGTYV